jgi:hypothetical protein
MIRKRIEFLTMMLLLVSVCIQAEILVLRNGSRIEGKILATGRVNTVVMIEDRYVVIETRNIEKILSEKKEIKKQEPKKEIKGIKKGNNKGGAKDKISIEKVVVQPTVAKDVAGTITAKLRVFRSTPWSWSKRQQTIKELAVMARRDRKSYDISPIFLHSENFMIFPDGLPGHWKQLPPPRHIGKSMPT